MAPLPSPRLPRYSDCLGPRCRHPRNEFGRDRCQDCGADLLLAQRFRLGERVHVNHGTGSSLTTVIDRAAPPNSPLRLLKVLHRTDAPWQHQFRRESQFLRHLSGSGQQNAIHAGNSVVPRSGDRDWLVFDYWASGIDCPGGFVMDYLPGRSLADELRQQGTIHWTRLQGWLPQLIQLVRFLHRHQIIHGDIKPSNLILCPDQSSQDRLSIVDFGAAGFVGDRLPLSQASPGFCPTTMVNKPLTYQRDWYALGWTCIQLLTGQHPLELTHLASLRWRERGGRPSEHSFLDWRALVPQMAPSLRQRMNSWMTI